jgi:hypothetical protein
MEKNIDDILELFLVAYVLDESEQRMSTRLTKYDDPYRGNEYTVRLIRCKHPVRIRCVHFQIVFTIHH